VAHFCAVSLSLDFFSSVVGIVHRYKHFFMVMI
jgi:hypothetical protein